MKKRFISIMMALLLVAGLPVSAFADGTYYLDYGDITVTATDDGSGNTTQTVSHYAAQGDTTQTSVTDSNPTITQHENTTTTNTVTINAGENATANVTIQNVEMKNAGDISTGSTDTAAIDINVAEGAEANVKLDNVKITDDRSNSSADGVSVDVADGATANVTLDKVDIDVSGTGGSDFYSPGAAAVYTTGEGKVNIELDNDSTLASGQSRAGLEKSGTGELLIKADNTTNGNLDATGGYGGAGIGGGYYTSRCSTSNITIESGNVTATGGTNAAGIGGGFANGSGYAGNASNINIKGGNVTAIAGDVDDSSSTKPAGIGGGSTGGGGCSGSGSNVTISGTVAKPANVKVVGGFGYKSDDRGMKTSLIPNTCALYGGFVKFYDSEDALESGSDDENKRLTGNSGGVHSYGEWITDTPATCKTQGEKHRNCIFEGESVQEKEIISVNPNAHDKVTFTEYVEPTCVKDGYIAHSKCQTCGEIIDKDVLPATGNHIWNDGEVTTEPTTESTGVMTYTCANCSATRTEDIPKLTPAASNTVAYAGQYSFAPLYRVTNEGNYDTEHTAVLKNGVLTITAEKDFASLKGRLWGIKVLMSQGVEKIVFVTNGATSAFVLADLLAEGGASDGYELTHDGANVTFTFGCGNADISSILQS